MQGPATITADLWPHAARPSRARGLTRGLRPRRRHNKVGKDGRRDDQRELQATAGLRETAERPPSDMSLAAFHVSAGGCEYARLRLFRALFML